MWATFSAVIRADAPVRVACAHRGMVAAHARHSDPSRITEQLSVYARAVRAPVPGSALASLVSSSCAALQARRSEVRVSL